MSLTDLHKKLDKLRNDTEFMKYHEELHPTTGLGFSWTAQESYKHYELYKQLEADKKLLLECVEFYSEGEDPEFMDDYERFCDQRCEHALLQSGHHSVRCEQRFGKRGRQCLEKLNSRININEKVEQS